MITAKDPGSEILALHRATHATLRALGARLAGLDLPPAQINVLANLADEAGRTVGALATATGSSPSTVTSALDRLTDRGYVRREVDPADRRSFMIWLTPEGRAVARQVAEVVAGLDQQALATVTPTQRAGFHAVLDALTEASR